MSGLGQVRYNPHINSPTNLAGALHLSRGELAGIDAMESDMIKKVYACLFFWVLTAVAAPAYGQSDVKALFHPTESSIKQILSLFKKSYSRVDIAMYNMDVSDRSDLFAGLQSKTIQARIENGDLEVRMIFEGYGSPRENLERVYAIEKKLGFDVRFLKSSRKAHHKYAVFYGSQTEEATVITGSANWSLKSQRKYDEQILVFEGLLQVSRAFLQQFNMLWGLSEDPGFTAIDPDFQGLEFEYPDGGGIAAEQEDGVSTYFSTKNFKVSAGTLKLKKEAKQSPALTGVVVSAIASAEQSLKIASTRINSRPIYDAITEALDRGVAVDIFVNKDQYKPEFVRNRWVLNGCSEENKKCCDSDGEYNAYLKQCSSGQIFAHFLDNKYQGSSDLRVRIKTFGLDPTAYLSNQMHSKYLIVDYARVLAGSFNYSVSSEYQHLENMVSFTAEDYPKAVNAFVQNFETIFERQRDSFLSKNGLPVKMENAYNNGLQIDCSYMPVSLSYAEADAFYNLPRGARKWRKLNQVCK